MGAGDELTEMSSSTLMKNKIKLSSYVYEEIQMGAVAQSFMRKGFLIYCMRKCANI